MRGGRTLRQRTHIRKNTPDTNEIVLLGETTRSKRILTIIKLLFINRTINRL